MQQNATIGGTMHHDYEYIIHNDGSLEKKDQRLAKELFSIEHARDARKFHRQIPGYRMTPLESLPNLASMLKIGGIYIKDEAQRLTLNSFKVMGGSYAVYRFIKKYLGAEDRDLSFSYLTSDECHERLKDVVFCSATDGNHGRGLAWASMVLGLKCHIYVHKD
ncbi:MAG: pyridoxal-phosphate dependent enzyme, partial [Spirochaetales bacterium]|nr:pyridoxal-phosphate dependent enzyme [Spirochaetales bacterium]